LRSLYLHGRFISSHLETGSYGNHYVADLVGLVSLGCLFPGSEARSWAKDGMMRLEDEIVRQVGEDGVQCESSISYHRLVTEAFATAMLFSRHRGISVSQEYRSKLAAMMEFVRYYTGPNGHSPVIGDADDGRIQILSERDTRDHSYLPDLGAVLLGMPGLACHPEPDEEVLWLLGQNFADNKLPTTESEMPGSRAFTEGGFYLMRKRDLYMIVRCGRPNPGAPRGHVHCDQLSFELHGRGNTFVMDPGTFVYTQSAAWRNLFRGSAYHNTVVVDGGEMNGFDDKNVFALDFRSNPQVHSWVAGDKYDFLDAEHPGYSGENEVVVHRRQVLFDRVAGAWCVRDIVKGSNPHRCDSHLHLASLPVNRLEDHSGILIGDGDARLTVLPLGESGELKISTGWISPSYGVKIEAPVVTWTKKGQRKTTFQMLLKVIDCEEWKPDPDFGLEYLEAMDELSSIGGA
jgi:hypothetical protein